MMILLTISLINSMLMMFLKHPLSMGFTLLMQSIVVSLTMGFYNINFWYSYILFIIMIGGMLVLFIYMTSIASNELFYPSMKLFLMILMIIISSIIITYYANYFYYSINNIYEIHYNYNFPLSLNKYFNFPNNMIMFMLIIYLLITLLAVVKITNIKMGPLRQLN